MCERKRELVNLGLADSAPSGSRYRIKLRPFLENRTVLEEDGHKAEAFKASMSEISVSTPASLLVTNTYYVVTLDSIDEADNVTQSQPFTFYVARQ